MAAMAANADFNYKLTFLQHNNLRKKDLRTLVPRLPCIGRATTLYRWSHYRIEVEALPQCGSRFGKKCVCQFQALTCKLLTFGKEFVGEKNESFVYLQC